MTAGEVGAKGTLGYCFENGIDVDREVSKTVKLYHKAIEEGDLHAKKIWHNALKRALV